MNDKMKKAKSLKITIPYILFDKPFEMDQTNLGAWISLLALHISSLFLFSHSFCFLLCSIFQFGFKFPLHIAKCFRNTFFFHVPMHWHWGCFRESYWQNNNETEVQSIEKKKFPAFLFCRLLVNLKRICWAHMGISFANMYSVHGSIIFFQNRWSFFLSHNRIVHQLLLHNSMRLSCTISMLTKYRK